MTYYIVSRGGAFTTVGNVTIEPKGYFVTTDREKALAKSREIENKKTYGTNTSNSTNRSTSNK